MWGITVPKTASNKPLLEHGAQLPLAFDLSPAEKSAATRKRRAKRQPPLRTCECGQRFRSWKKDALCGRCPDAARPEAAAAPSKHDLGGAEDDGSLHFLLTGERES